ncbi:MAG: ABC transporter permease [Defluviitaleaceae bacterium]|nr:ABC transporter permease [Defluviitaleaceae bacterium]
MRKNILLKSMVRQPLRTALLVILIGLATFAFFLRTAEFLTVRSQIGELAGMYRPIGVIGHNDYWGDVSEGAELIAQSPLVEHVDIRQGVEGVLQNMYSPDVAGMNSWMPHEDRPRITEAVFTATITDMWAWETDFIEDADGHGLSVWMMVNILDSYVGFPEHVSSRGRSWLAIQLPYGEDYTFLRYLAVSDAVHLFRGAFYLGFFDTGDTYVPTLRSASTLSLIPLYEDGPLFKTLYAPDISPSFYGLEQEDEITNAVTRHGVTTSIQRIEGTQAWGNDAILELISPEEFWTWTVGFESLLDTDFIPYETQADFEYLERHLRTVYLQATRDMTAMPTLQRGSPFRLGIGNPVGQYLHMLRSGRLLTASDYENSNPVAVIDSRFGWIRDVEIGDTIEVAIPLEQEIVGLTAEHREFMVRGLPGAEYYLLELEVVGIIVDFFTADPHVRGTVTSAFIHIPESLLPEGLTVAPPQAEVIPDWHGENHLPSIWFSFELNDARHEQAFLLEYGPQLREMGLELILFESRPGDFWAVADPMIMMVTFNAIVFWAVLLLVLALVVFLFLSQRRKDIAIQQGLGFTPGRVIARLQTALLIFGIPAIIIGGFLGWHIATETTAYTLEAVVELIPGFVPDIELTPLWFAVMAFVVLGIGMLMLFGGSLYMTRIPVLNQLQGVFNRPRTMRKKASPVIIRNDTGAAALPTTFHLSKMEFVFSTTAAISGGLRWVMRQIRRAPIKSTLGVGVALFFILVMGWLYESIVRAEGNVDQLLMNTTVTGEVQIPGFFVSHQAHVTSGMPRHLAIDIKEGGYFSDYIMAGGHARSFIIPFTDNGFPSDWYDVIDYDTSLPIAYSVGSLDTLFAFNNFDLFMEDNYLEDFGGLEIDFLPGYNGENFAFTEGATIPIIVPYSLLERRGIALGDTVYVGHTTYNMMAIQYAYAKIIGVHNEFVTPHSARMATLLPLDAIEYLLGVVVMYNDFRFTISPEHNHDITHVVDFVDDVLRNRYVFQIWDEALNYIIGIARQTLLLLELIYPLALGTSVIIAGGLSMLLMLQNAKAAAILHVVGTSKKKTMAMLLSEQLIVCLGGVVPGLIALALMGVTFDVALFMAVGLYLGAVAAGAIVGAIMVINRPPLALLQVKE